MSIGTLFGKSALAQVVGIKNGDGSLLTTTWCFEDTMHALQGFPAGGSFSGCGIVEQNGHFYFNPARAAAGATQFIFTCTITYTPPAATGYSKVNNTMRVNAPIVIDAGEDRIICQHGDFELPVNSVYGSAYKYEWSPAAFIIDPTQNPAKGSIALHDSQTFYLTVRDANSGCMAYDTVTLYDRSVFAEVLEAIPDTICVNSALTLNARVYDEYSYRWYSGTGEDMEGTAFHQEYNTGGDYLLMLVVEDEFCPDTVKHRLHVADFQLQLEVDRQEVERMEQINLSSSASFGPYDITSWSPAHLFPDQSALDQSINADSTRFFTITGVTSTGCVDTASVFVTVIPRVFVPNVFSPNGDGLNDVFQIISYGDVLTVSQFEIYDRWGRKVWMGRGSSEAVGWNGEANGQPMEVGTYFYSIRATTRQGELFNRQGDVILVR